RYFRPQLRLVDSGARTAPDLRTFLSWRASGARAGHRNGTLDRSTNRESAWRRTDSLERSPHRDYIHAVAARWRFARMSAGRILVVDDDPQIRRVMRVTLTGQGYEVDDAKTGESALEKLREERFDLVLLDMNMPGMGGIETCRSIRGHS